VSVANALAAEAARAGSDEHFNSGSSSGNS
jgi:hypothetical protein